PTRLRARFGLASARGDYPAAERYLRELQTNGPSSPFWREQDAMDAAGLYGVQGKIAQAEEQYRTAAQVAESRGVLTDYLVANSSLALMELRQRNRPDQAQAVLGSA